MKILKYTFDIPKLIVEDGELLEAGTVKETYTFTLLFKGVGLYEKLTGKPLLNELSKYSGDVKDIDIEFIKNVAKASYAKIEGNQFHQNMITAEEFSKTEAFNRVLIDVDFMTALIEMVMDCVVPQTQKDGLKAQATKK